MWKYSTLILTVLFSSCSMETFIIRQTGALLDYGVISLYDEPDLVIAEQALASDIKLLEGMILGDPDNQHLRLLTTQAIAGYAMGFAEEQFPERAKALYLRAGDHSKHILRYNDFFAKNEEASLDDFITAVNTFEEDDIDALFWAAFAWAGWINLSLDNPQAYIDLPKVEAMMQRVVELDKNYFYASAYLFFGSVWGSKPKMLGGDPEKAKEYFEKNLELTKGNFLLTYIYYAKYYAAKILDEKLFVKMLQKVEETPVDVLPGGRLFNAIAKDKSKRLLNMRNNLF